MHYVLIVFATNIWLMFYVIQDEMTTHNCVKELRGALQATNNKLTNTQIQVTELKNQLKEQEREVSRMLTARYLTQNLESLSQPQPPPLFISCWYAYFYNAAKLVVYGCWTKYVYYSFFLH